MSSRMQELWPLSETELKPALAFALAIEHAPMGLLMLRDDASGTLEIVVAEGLTAEQWERFGPQQPGVGPVGVAYAEHRHITIRDVAQDCEGFQDSLRDIADCVGFRGLDVVPLSLGDGTVIGAVAVFFRGARRPSARSAQLAERAGRLLALALDNARLRAEADRRREDAEALARARVQFVARMSHELRTPLQSITGYIDLLSLGWPEPLTYRQGEMLERVRKSEEILISVIDDLVSLARLEAGRVDYKTGPVALSDAMAMAEIVVLPLAQQRGVALQVIPDQRNLKATADDAKLKQILINLLTNAIKYTPSGGSVRLSCREDGSRILVDVTDTGPGIPPDKLGDVFLPYVQLGQQVDGLSGSGLGLAISREFAQGMGGELTVASAPGEGSIFTVQLERHAEEPAWRGALAPSVAQQ
ncbi:MAG TPA: ATP-binding protein [Gemmatimonadaceae bacterium]|nr:ATP-binding protein [Gemmatimonadaceae bacterium]